VQDLRRRVRAADGILLGSPEYHNSFSGVLKNALDLMGSEELKGKLFGLLGVAGGSAGAINTLGHLRVVVRGVGGWSLPVQISIANVRNAFDGDKLVDPELEQRIRFFGRELVRFTRLYSLVPELEHRLMEIIDENV
jgi:NAD(P)H-dependent FMN reductase